MVSAGLPIDSVLIFGSAARYVYNLKCRFSWLDFSKSLVISPIVLLPLVSSVQANQDITAMQIVYFDLLAFQNGFFWHTVLERAQLRR